MTLTEVEALEVTETQHWLHITDGTGDTRIMWNPRDDDEVATAQAAFDAAKAKGMLAYQVDDDGKATRTVVRKFDKKAGKIIMVRQPVGVTMPTQVTTEPQQVVQYPPTDANLDELTTEAADLLDLLKDGPPYPTTYGYRRLDLWCERLYRDIADYRGYRGLGLMAIVLPQGWQQTSTINTTATTMSVPVLQDDVWQVWTSGTTTGPLTWSNATTYNSTTTTMSTLANDTWRDWQVLPHRDVYTWEDIRPWTDTRTPEEIQAAADRAQAAQEEASRQRLAAQQVLAMAQDRAMGLLLSLLTEEEARHHLQYDEIKVRSEHGNLYVIEKRGVHGNITLTDEHGCRLGRICVAPKMSDEQGRYLPSADGWLGQYLMLKHDEDLIIGRGNWSQRGVCQHPGVPILAQQERVAA